MNLQIKLYKSKHHDFIFTRRSLKLINSLRIPGGIEFKISEADDTILDMMRFVNYGLVKFDEEGKCMVTEEGIKVLETLETFQETNLETYINANYFN